MSPSLSLQRQVAEVAICLAFSQESQKYPPPGKMCWTYFETIGHSLKNLSPSQKNLRPSWCLKLVTGLLLNADILAGNAARQ